MSSPVSTVQRQDRREIQIVAAAGAPDVAVPRRAVAGADIQELRVRVVRERVPRRAAAAHLPPFAGPGFRGGLERLRLERLRRIAGHRVEAPGELAGVCVVRGHIAAHAELGAAVADDDLAVDDSRRARDRVRLIDRRRLHVPDAACRSPRRARPSARRRCRRRPCRRIARRRDSRRRSTLSRRAHGSRVRPTSRSARRCARRARTRCSSSSWHTARRSRRAASPRARAARPCRSSTRGLAARRCRRRFALAG